jgi:hypothetical protein
VQNSCSVDRTVMTYLPNDRGAASLIEHRPDPTDRRARRIVATHIGSRLLTGLNDRLYPLLAQAFGQLDRAHPSGRSLVCREWRGSGDVGSAPASGGEAVAQRTP